MKRYQLLLALPLISLAVTGCGKTSNPGSDSSTNPDGGNGGTVTRPGGDNGGDPQKATSMEKALNYNYNNCTVGIDTLWAKGEMETYYVEYYNGQSIVEYTPALSEYGSKYMYTEYYVDDDGTCYTWWDAQTDVANSKGGWINKGYKNADLSIWKANFYLQNALSALNPEDFTITPIGTYYITDPAKRAQYIDEVFSWLVYETEGAAYPVDVAFVLDSETSALKKIYGFFDEGTNGNDDDCVEVEFMNIGTTNISNLYQVHEKPNDTNKTTYWQYYGWEHDYEAAYYTDLQLNVASPSSEKVTVNGNSVEMDIDKKFGVNLLTTPSKFQPWDLVDYEHSQITYEYDESILEMVSSFDYSEEFHSLREGTTTIKATVLGENGQIFSNEITVTVRAAAQQELANAVYKFSWVGYTDDENPTVLTAVNDYGNGLPYTINSTDRNGAKILESTLTDVFEDGINILAFAPGHATTEDGKPSSTTGVTFDFDDQQVSEFSFYYASFYSGQLPQILSRLTSVTVESSNDGVSWESQDILNTLKEDVSDDFEKLLTVNFAPATKVRLTFKANMCGFNGTIGLRSVAFSKNDACHDHNTSVNVPVTGVSLSKTSTSIVAGNKETLIAAVEPATATNPALVWESSDTNIATVENGVVTAVAEGSATITVTTVDGSFQATCAVTVLPLPTVSAEFAGKYVCDDHGATIVIDDTTNSLTYTDDSYTVTLPIVSVDGKVLVFSNGTDKVTLTINSEGLYLSTSGSTKLNGTAIAGIWDFTKEILATSFSIKVSGVTANSDGNYPVLAGDSVTVFATSFLPTNANVKEVEWTVTNGTGTGTYDEETCTFKALTAGTVTLSAKLNNSVEKSVTFDIAAVVLPTSITVTGADGATSLYSGKTLQLTAAVNPTDASDKSVTWSSSDNSIATVSTKGLVTAKTVTEAKTVTITATSVADGTVTGSITLTVSPAPTTGVVPEGMVGTWTMDGSADSGCDYISISVEIGADGKIKISDGGSFIPQYLDGEFVSKSGNVYTFNVEGDREFTVTFDGDTITAASYDDTDCEVFYVGDVIEFENIEKA